MERRTTPHRDKKIGTPERRSVILVNPAHGNEPYILGAKIAVRVSALLVEQGLPDVQVVIPELYPENKRQERILREELNEQGALVHLDRELGQTLKKILFGANDFPGHLHRIINSASEVEEEIKNHFSRPFQAENIVTEEDKTFSPAEIIASIDASPRVLLPAPFRASAFPALLPEILVKAHAENIVPGITEDEWGRIMQQVEKVERGNDLRFLPRFHTFAYEALGERKGLSADKTYDLLQQDATNRSGWDVVYTPPMKSPAGQGQSDELHYGDGILAMYSGTASGLDDVEGASKDVGLHVYDNKTVLRDTTSIIADDRIKVVVSRAGQGTGWQVYLAAKPWVVTPYRTPDDPELYFDNKMLEQVGLGVVLQDTDKVYVEQALIDAQAMKPRLETLRRRQRQEFGTLDGIEFMAQRIVKELLKARDEGKLAL